MTRCPRCQRRLPPRGECGVHGRPTHVEGVEDVLPAVAAPPGFTLGFRVAIGGSSVVYSAAQPTGAPAIVKWGRWRDRDIQDRFEHEAAMLRAVGAPLAPGYLTHGAHDGWPYLVMEEVPGETLAAWMSRSGDRGALGEIASILLRVARALDALHERGFIHRDLKPENIVITSHDTWLLDFGLAAREADGIVQRGVAAGTIHYIAPEQLRTGSVIDRRADVYSFGVIAYEMIAGQPPFTGERRAIEYQHQVARPQTMRALAEQLTQASAYIQTLKGVGTSARKILGSRDDVVLVWIEGGDPIAIARAITDVHGIIVRSRPGTILAAFAAQFHDAPVAVALAACRAFAQERCRVVVHLANVLVRRSATGKPAFYGPDIEKPASWIPAVPFTGIVVTGVAAQRATTPLVAAADVPGFFRDLARDRTDATDARREPRLVGRDRIVQDVAAVANAGGVVIGVFGGEGIGKTRVLAAVAERLARMKREVLAVRGRRRLLGDHPDDRRLLDALGGGRDLTGALASAAARRVVVVVDDAHHFSAAAQHELVRADLAVTRVVASRVPLFEAVAGEARRIAIHLQPLAFTDADRLLRDLLEPARLIPDVLVQRLAIRAAGNPGLLVALARDIQHRGGIRREEGSDDWYVAADEIDTLLASPSAAWLAARALDALAPELAPIVATASALGPSIELPELAAVCERELADIASALRWLVRDGVLVERDGAFEFADGTLQDAIYEHALDERTHVHARALRYWLAHCGSDVVPWLARVSYHASGAGDAAAAAACSTILAREARRRGEDGVAAEHEQRALASLVSVAPAALAAALASLEGR
jgi:predicted Ser/Thr protein kinase